MDQQKQNDDAGTSDLALGREEIGKALGGRTASQVSYLLSKGFLAGAVRKLGHKTLVGSKQRLRDLAVRLIDQA